VELAAAFFDPDCGTAGEQQISPLRGFAAPLEMTKKRWTPGIELIPRPYPLTLICENGAGGEPQDGHPMSEIRNCIDTIVREFS
jgi:hypothetical protein